MNRFLILILLSNISLFAFSQQRDLKKIADSIKAEGELLYRSEWASGNGTAIFAASYPSKKLLSGGYISYDTKKDVINIFYSKEEYPKVIATVKFDKRLDSTKYTIDTATRNFNDTEKELFVLRKKAADAITTDTFFKFHAYTSHNLVPVIKNGEKKVYVVTAQTSPNEVLLGDDYLINFDKLNNIASKTKLHNNLIPLPNGGKEVIEASSHVHLGTSSNFITATDVCTFKLWKPKITWVITFVQSAGFVSAWHFRDEYLDIYTMADWEKMMKKN